MLFGKSQISLRKAIGLKKNSLTKQYVVVRYIKTRYTTLHLTLRAEAFEETLNRLEERDMIGYSTENALSEDLWQIASDTIDVSELGTGFSSSLHAWITIGVQRMIRQNRVEPQDVMLAHTNLIKLIRLLKQEALGHLLRLDNNTLRATKKRLRLRASATAFELWPFWPHNFVAP
jgi:hypothetical protein